MGHHGRLVLYEGELGIGRERKRGNKWEEGDKKERLKHYYNLLAFSYSGDMI